jgi:hypothetical protein
MKTNKNEDETRKKTAVKVRICFKWRNSIDAIFILDYLFLMRKSGTAPSNL